MTTRKTSTRLLLWLAGYVAAFALAVLALLARLWLSDTADASSGMAAFGDALFFLVAFAVLAAVPTVAGLYLIRGSPRFWRALAGLAALVALSGLAALALLAAVRLRLFPADTTLGLLPDLAVLRLLPAPLILFALALAGIVAPPSPARRAIWICLGVEALVGVGAVAFWR